MNKKTHINELPKKIDLPAIEEQVLQFWKDTKAFEHSVEMRPEDKPYVFYDGPPFATGMPHYGHLLGSTSKDVIPRYWTMKGYRVERIWGWDCHGLPIENMIEKQLKIQGGKKGIEELGIDTFNQACRAEVLRLDTEWERIIDRLGRWVDFEHNYKTMETSFMESVWWGFSQLYEKGLVYEGRRVILYCPRCSTPLSNFEIAMDNSYSEVTEPSNTYKYKIAELENTYILAWSTTPWNKLATPALAVNPDLNYVFVKQGNEEYILAESRLDMLQGEYSKGKSLTGAELAAQYTFEPHYDFYPNRTDTEQFGCIIADTFVTDDEGTGVVTLAVYGEDDFRVMKEHSIQLVEHVDEEGKLKPEVTPWAGMDILEVNPLVNEDLASRGLLYSETTHTHNVAECYRCSTRLYYAPLPAWFIDVNSLRPRLIEENEKMNWYPDHLKEGRFGKGLETAPDWNISRSRYWGTPMPIWRGTKKNEDGTEQVLTRVISSREELKKWAVNPNDLPDLSDIHREFIDTIEVWVDDERTVSGTRIPEVFDCWVESGSMPYASVHYPFENKQRFETTYPAQFVSEYIAQTRAWFYTMHVMSVGIFDKHAVENTLTTGTILAEDGSKMSKSKNNYPDPVKLLDTIGADSLRLYLMSSPVMKSENFNFSEKDVADIRRKVFLIWYNCISFYKLATNNSPVTEYSGIPKNIMDAWIWSSLQTLTQKVTASMDNYDVVTASRLLMRFVSDLSTWYLRRSRDRLRGETALAESQQVYGTVLLKFAQLMAPFAPFFTEFSYHQLVDNSRSIHHTDWPIPDTAAQNEALEQNMELVRAVVEKVHAARSEAGIKVRQPLQSVTITSTQEKVNPDLLAVIAQEVNVKEIFWKSGDETHVLLDTTLTPELEAEGAARELLRSIQQLRKKAGLSLGEQATVTAPNIPKDWKEHIEQKTSVTLKEGDTLALVT